MNEHESKMPNRNGGCDAADHRKFTSHAREHFELAREYAIRECRGPDRPTSDWMEQSYRQMVRTPQMCMNPYLTGPLLLGISLLHEYEFMSYALNDNLSRGLTTSGGSYPLLSLPPSADGDPVAQLIHRAKSYLGYCGTTFRASGYVLGMNLVNDFLNMIDAAFRREGGRLLQQLKKMNSRYASAILNATLLISEMMTKFDGSPDTSVEVLSALQYPESAIDISKAICGVRQ